MARTIRKSGMKEVPLSEIKDDLSRFLREAENRRSLLRATASRRDCSSASSRRRTGLTTGSKMIRDFCAVSNRHVIVYKQAAGSSWKTLRRNDRARLCRPYVARDYEQIFFNSPLLIVEDVSHSVRELRLQALGRTDTGRLLHISFTLRGDGRLIRVISARTMQR